MEAPVTVPNVPAGHFVQLKEPADGANEPAGQGVQSGSDRPLGEKEPVEQTCPWVDVQLVAPALEVVPFAQGEHTPEPVAEYVPDEQGEKEEQAEIPLKQQTPLTESR